jgi:hypothetical protein
VAAPVKTASIGAAIACAAAAFALTYLLDLPSWTPFAVIVSFPLYWLVLRTLGQRRFEAWVQAIRDRAARGEAPESPEAWLPADRFVWWYAPRPRLVRELWAATRSQRAGHKIDFGPYYEEAVAAPDPPFELLEDHGDHLMALGRFADADRAFRRAIEGAEKEGPRFKIWCKLAVACARDGRYGAADGALHEAYEIMPTGDPGFQALHDRARDEIAAAKDAARGAQIHLVQLVKKT